MLSKFWHWIKKYKVWLVSILALGVIYIGLPEVLRCYLPDYIINGWFDYSYKLTKAEETQGVARGLAFLLAVPIALFALILTALRTTAQTAQAKTDSDRLLAETFAKSIELLGHKQSAVRQGAIYALGKIAETNIEERAVIANTLCAFIRDSKSTEKSSTDNTEKSNTDNLAIDIEAGIKVMVRISKDLPKYNRDKRPYDLSNIHIKYADFSDANLENFNLSDSTFKTCLFEKTNFMNSNLIYTTFDDSNFQGAKFNKDTELKKANLSKVKNLTEEQIAEIMTIREEYREGLELPQP